VVGLIDRRIGVQDVVHHDAAYRCAYLTEIVYSAPHGDDTASGKRDEDDGIDRLRQ